MFSLSCTAFAVSKLFESLTDIHDWLSRSRLRVNLSKTQAMWLGSGQELDKIDIREVSIMSTRVSVEHNVRDLVSFSTADSLWPTMSLPYAALLTTNCVRNDLYCVEWGVKLYSLTQLRPVVRSLSADGAMACYRLVTGAPRREHITPIFMQLHWLPVRQYGTSWQPWHSDHYQARSRRILLGSGTLCTVKLFSGFGH